MHTLSINKTKRKSGRRITKKRKCGRNSSEDGGRGGVLCYMPYTSLDAHNKSTFKIESASNIKELLKNNKKFFPTGFYVIAILKSPTVGVSKIKNRKIYYQVIKDKIIEFSLKNGGITDQKDDYGWVYCTIDNIHNAFRKAEEMYGGVREEFNISGKLYDSMKIIDVKNTKKPLYVGKVIFHT